MQQLSIVELIALRIAAGMKREALAVALGVHPTTVARWERHPTTVRVNMHIRKAWQTFLQASGDPAPTPPADDHGYAQRCADKAAHDTYLKDKKEEKTP